MGNEREWWRLWQIEERMPGSTGQLLPRSTLLLLSWDVTPHCQFALRETRIPDFYVKSPMFLNDGNSFKNKIKKL